MSAPPENYPSEIIVHGHDHSHDHGHSHSHEHQQPNYLSKSRSVRVTGETERAAGGNGSATLSTSHLTSSRGCGEADAYCTGNERSCMAGIKVICCFPICRDIERGKDKDKGQGQGQHPLHFVCVLLLGAQFKT